MASYYHARVHEERPMLTVKLLQTTQKKKPLGSKCRDYKKWQNLVIMQQIFDSKLETRRDGPESGVSWIIRES